MVTGQVSKHNQGRSPKWKEYQKEYHKGYYLKNNHKLVENARNRRKCISDRLKCLGNVDCMIDAIIKYEQSKEQDEEEMEKRKKRSD